MERNDEQLQSDYVEENKQSDLTDAKNTTLKKIQFYITMIVGIVFVILIIFTLLKNLIGNGNKKETVVENETPKVQKLKKDDFFTKLEEDEKDISKNENKKDVDIFSSVSKIKPPKPQIVKGEIGVMIGNNRTSNYNNINSDISKYDEQIAQLQTQREQILNQVNTPSDDYSKDTFSPTIAKINQFNPDFLLPKGTYIGCSLDTRFVSSISGSTSCTVSQNIYSTNGNVLLIEKGSKIFGTFKGGEANDGTSRYLVIWQEIRTLNHLRIPVNSGASDELGASGLYGEIDHKWLIRFGSSIMLSIVDDMFNVLAWKITNQNNNRENHIDYTENTRENASNIASIALEKFINIKPTIYKQHGDLVGVYVNRDIDFSKVYRLKKK